MGRAMPEEIIHEILSPALSVSDDTFSDRHLYSSESSSVESSSAILLVCKAWLRVATPLLYHTVILRSKGQAQALSVALRCNPDLGQLIRKLRLQSGYGSSLHQILRTTTKLTDIFIPVEFDEGDDACGLCSGIPSIDPVRVIVSYDPFEATTPEPVRTLVSVLIENIPKWKNLATFEMPHDWQHSEAGHNETFSSPLKVAPNLRTLVLSCNWRDLFRDGIIPEYISTVAQNASLQEIRAKTRSRKALKPGFLETVQGNARLQELVDPNGFGPKKAFVYPPQLAANPTVADVIWDRIIYYVFREDDDDFYPDDDDSDCDYFENQDSKLPERWEPLRVCKRFLRLGTPRFYNDISLRTCKSMLLFTARLRLEPSLGAHVHSLFIGRNDQQTIDDLQNVFSRIPRLTELYSVGTLILPWRMFEELTIRYGSHLDWFDITVTPCAYKVDPIVFYRLSAMQNFTWNSDAEFYSTVTFATSNAMNNLKELSVSRAHPSFFVLLSQMQLPSLSTVTLQTGKLDTRIFFKKHGAKLSKLFVGALAFNLEMFNFCRNVKVLNVCVTSKAEQVAVEDVLQWCDTHCSLKQIVINPKSFDAEESALAELFLAKFDPTPFPALEEIRHLGFSWPPSAAPILADSPWVKLAERFRAQNIHLVDPYGHRWRPRREFVPEGGRG
ncbi:hypothetical protein FB45DRAFT_1068970 [Roridomyces roridus]|uniref:F-box domain-containing protein n=1 Tax=Roridomyces roridus TaxID=1738132 RepID=A0AAD7AZS2_9AGAR|nr:hypothetical protein FB45DRAFT_1068970 [Roridomyces roridus]